MVIVVVVVAVVGTAATAVDTAVFMLYFDYSWVQDFLTESACKCKRFFLNCRNLSKVRLVQKWLTLQAFHVFDVGHIFWTCSVEEEEEIFA